MTPRKTLGVFLFYLFNFHFEFYLIFTVTTSSSKRPPICRARTITSCINIQYYFV